MSRPGSLPLCNVRPAGVARNNPLGAPVAQVVIKNDFEGKWVVVTGAAQGIGKGLVQTFARLGAQVCFSDVNEAAGIHLQQSLRDEGRVVSFHKADMGDEADIRNFAATVLSHTAGMDLLINNVGVSDFGSKFEDRSLAEWNRMVAQGLTSHWLCSQVFTPALKKARGCIINISSTRALMSEENSEPYSASKGGIVALTHSLAITLGKHGIRVNCISPGWIDVSGWQYPPHPESLSESAHAQHPVGRVGSPEDIAEACLFLGSPSSAGFITGQNLVVDGGMVRKMIYQE